MSINFYCPDAPAVSEGQEDQAEVPILNLGNDTAKALLRLMHLPDQSEGKVAVSDIPAVTRRLLLTVNSEKTRALEHIPPGKEKGAQGARVVELGMSDRRLQHYATQLLALFDKARKHNYPVVWA